jgi:hypothetical protein
MRGNAGDRINKPDAGRAETHHLRDPEPAGDAEQSDAEAIAAERTGRTNTARDMIAAPDQGATPGRWDSIGEPGEGLDELQGLYAADAPARDQLPEQGEVPPPATIDQSLPEDTITPALWEQLMALEGQTIKTPKGEPFRVIAVTRGEQVTVSPLDGAREWDVPAQELEAAWQAVSGGAELDGLASIRLQEAGVGSAHPEYVAGLLQALSGRGAE